MRRQKCILQHREPCALESLLLEQVHSGMARVKKEGACMSATNLPPGIMIWCIWPSRGQSIVNIIPACSYIVVLERT